MAVAVRDSQRVIQGDTGLRARFWRLKLMGLYGSLTLEVGCVRLVSFSTDK